MTINVINQEIVRARESKVYAVVPKQKSQKKEKTKKSRLGCSQAELLNIDIIFNFFLGKKTSNEESDLPEVDQNTNKTLRKQKVK